MSTVKPEKGIAEHFVCFLARKGYFANGYIVDKKELLELYKSEYLPQYHVRMKPFYLLPALQRSRCLKKKKKNSDTTEVVFVAEKIKEILPKHVNTVQDSLTPPPDTPLTKPVVKVYVTQQHAFHIGMKRAPGVTNTECKLCMVSFTSESEYEAHVALESHIVRERYRTNRKSLSSKHKIVVKSKSEDVTEDFIVRQNAPASLTIAVSNVGEIDYQILRIFVMCELNEIVERFPALPLQLKPGGRISMAVDYNFNTTGVFIYPLVLKLSTNDSPYILKELVFRVQSEIIDDLKPTSEFKRPMKSVQKRKDAPIVYGEPLPPTPSSLVNARKLPQYETPASLRRVLNHGLKPFQTMSPADKSKLQQVRTLLKLDSTTSGEKLLSEDKYSELFRLLLYIEEHQMENDIHTYDCDDQELNIVQENRTLLSLRVPGLSENRPSILRGDSVLVMIQGDSCVKYEGVVHCIRESEVWLAFHKSLRDKFLPNMKFHVEYQFNRWPLRCQHRALEMVKSHNVATYLFPKGHTSIPLKKVAINSWFNDRQLSTNPQQQQAVRNIVSGSSFPAPYLIFGPPGTGKTVTMVEAITQLYHLNKPNGHLLVCAPSNSAADELTRRLLISCRGHVPDSSVLRLYSASRSPQAIPQELKKCCNYTSDGFYYPSKEDIMKYGVLVVTLASSGRLVNGAVPSGHFSHLFIDESGQAVEPEALIPVASLFTSDKEKGRLLGQLVLAGDPKQLGPVLRSTVAIKLGLSISLLERLMDDCSLYKKDASNKYNAAVLTKLVRNFRSHQKILALPNEMFYDNELEACGDPALTSLACNWDRLPKKGFPLIFHGVKGKDQREGTSPSYFNLQEIDIIMNYVGSLMSDRFSGRKLSQADIGVITPYRKQVEKLKKAFKKKKWESITVGSVEEFQGQERLVIIISTVRSTFELLHEDYKFHLGFLKNPKRFNVALTRSKSLLITVGDPNVLQYDKHWRELILFCRENKSYVGCAFTPVPLPRQEMEELDFQLSSLQIDTAGPTKTGDDPNWRSDI